eukprot:SAG31_NODE_2720_length_5190_cov_3.678256_3_plen_70_part_00
MANFSAKIEPAIAYEYKGWTVGKCGPWSQGPAMLQCLALLKGFDLDKVRGYFLVFVPTIRKIRDFYREM